MEDQNTGQNAQAEPHKIFVTAFTAVRVVRNKITVEVGHLSIANHKSAQEAESKLLEKALRERPASDGWTGHTASVSEVPREVLVEALALLDENKQAS
jgi:hypothetical protein